jgi:NADH dehydrogenase
MSGPAVITGAFSYTGAAVADELLKRGYEVRTLTNRRSEKLPSAPLKFEQEHLEAQLRGAETFVNTYWIRLPYAGQTFDTAVKNSRMLIDAAKSAGVRRFVHISVSNAEKGTNLGYYRGKDRVEKHLRESGVAYSIVKPTLIVGPGDVLTNNIAWFLRRLLFFLVPGGGRYRIQPVMLGDVATITADAAEASGNVEVDAAGPDIIAFRDYVKKIAKACRLRRWVFGAPTWLALPALKLFGLFLRDVILTREEILGLKQELLVTSSSPVGKESVLNWLGESGNNLGRKYANDLDRHFRRPGS